MQKKLQEMYDPTYFKSLHKISSIAANNSAKPLLSEIKDYLDGRYIASEINIFEGLVLESGESEKINGRRVLGLCRVDQGRAP